MSPDDPRGAPTGLRVATWNVNSLRARLPRVLAFLERRQPDVLLLQETKVADGAFPVAALEAHGYRVAQHGLDSWNGVAIASRVGIDDVVTAFPGAPAWGEPGVVEARAITATCGGLRVTSVYVPNGREIDHLHYHYKLAWLEALRDHLAAQLAADPDAPLVVGGDFNIAPTDADVWSVEFYAERTHTTPRERAAFAALLEIGLHDAVRPFTSAPGTFTYWDYQQLRFPKNRGMRIDFLLVAPALAPRVVDAVIDRDERKGTGASDHAPVLVDLAPARTEADEERR